MFRNHTKTCEKGQAILLFSCCRSLRHAFSVFDCGGLNKDGGHRLPVISEEIRLMGNALPETNALRLAEGKCSPEADPVSIDGPDAIRQASHRVGKVADRMRESADQEYGGAGRDSSYARPLTGLLLRRRRMRVVKDRHAISQFAAHCLDHHVPVRAGKADGRT